MTTNDLDSAVYICTSKRFRIGITLTIADMSKFNSSAKYASKTNGLSKSRLYRISPTCNEGSLTCFYYFIFSVNILLVHIGMTYISRGWSEDKSSQLQIFVIEKHTSISYCLTKWSKSVLWSLPDLVSCACKCHLVGYGFFIVVYTLFLLSIMVRLFVWGILSICSREVAIHFFWSYYVERLYSL